MDRTNCGMFLWIALLAAALNSIAQTTYQDVNATPQARAADLVSRMTLEEKVGQMMNAAPAIPAAWNSRLRLVE